MRRRTYQEENKIGARLGELLEQSFLDKAQARFKNTMNDSCSLPQRRRQ